MSRGIRDLREIVCVSRLGYAEPSDESDSDDEASDFMTQTNETSNDRRCRSAGVANLTVNSAKRLPKNEHLLIPPQRPFSSRPFGTIPSTSRFGKSVFVTVATEKSNLEFCSRGKLNSVNSERNISPRNIRPDIRPYSARNYDDLLAGVNTGVLSSWLEAANVRVREMDRWCRARDNFVCLAHLWLSAVPDKEKSTLINRLHKRLVVSLSEVFCCVECTESSISSKIYDEDTSERLLELGLKDNACSAETNSSKNNCILNDISKKNKVISRNLQLGSDLDNDSSQAAKSSMCSSCSSGIDSSNSSRTASGSSCSSRRRAEASSGYSDIGTPTKWQEGSEVGEKSSTTPRTEMRQEARHTTSLLNQVLDNDNQDDDDDDDDDQSNAQKSTNHSQSQICGIDPARRQGCRTPEGGPWVGMEPGNTIYPQGEQQQQGDQPPSTDLEQRMAFLGAIFREYPTRMLGVKGSHLFLDYLDVLTSDRSSRYRRLLSDVKCWTNEPCHAQSILAIRSVALVTVWSEVVSVIRRTLGREDSHEDCDSIRESEEEEEVSEEHDGLIDKDVMEIDAKRLYQAIRLNYVEVVRYLLSSGKVSPRLVDSQNKSLIFHSVISNRPDILHFLIAEVGQGLDVNVVARNGNTALHAAANVGCERLVTELLLAKVLHIDALNTQCDNATPLHIAVMQGHAEIVRHLLKAGANRDLKMGDSRAVDLARDFQHSEILDILTNF